MENNLCKFFLGVSIGVKFQSVITEKGVLFSPSFTFLIKGVLTVHTIHNAQ